MRGNYLKYLLLENVKNLVGKKFKSQFDDWLFYLEQLGYDTYWQVLNAKNYGIPQNRERVFAISIRKDLNKTFEFPKAEELKIRLKDILEDEVDEKFYLKQSMVDFFIKNSLNNEEKGNGFRFKPHNPHNADTAFAITTRAGGRMDDNFVLNENLNDKPFFQFDKENTIKVIGASRGRNPDNPSDRTVGAPTEQRLEIIESKPELVGGIGEINFGKQYQQGNRVYDSNAIAMAVMANPVGNARGFSYLYQTGLRIRKLTPLECWRLMGFDDEDFRKAEASGVSNTQLYKQAGNSIVVNVLEKIFENLYK